ncbi:MAG: hypothetical protein LBU34_10695 [Planctomycetaceae bacterium]|nr:hypothetical protein [Planctomycetaceae bacterium]
MIRHVGGLCLISCLRAEYGLTFNYSANRLAVIELFLLRQFMIAGVFLKPVNL